MRIFIHYNYLKLYITDWLNKIKLPANNEKIKIYGNFPKPQNPIEIMYTGKQKGK